MDKATEDQATTEASATTKMGGCEGEKSMYVKLISSDDHEFILKRQLVASSLTLEVSFIIWLLTERGARQSKSIV